MTQVTITLSIADALVALTAIAGKTSTPVTVETKTTTKLQPAAASASAADAAAPAPAKTQAAASPPPADAPLEYDVLRKAVFELAGLSKDAAMAVNAQFGVKTMKELGEGNRRAALAAVQAKIAELKSAGEEVA